METIAFYITDAGFGHITRNLAIIEQMLKYSDNHIYLACGKNQLDYAKVFLHKYMNRVTFKEVSTGAGTVLKENSFEVDKKRTEDRIRFFLASLDDNLEKEVEQLRTMNVRLVVSDISMLGINAAKVLGVQVVGITNYTHYHRYKKFGLDEKLIQPFLDSLNSLDCLYEYGYSDDMSDLTCPKVQIGVVARKINSLASSDFRQRYWPSVYISVGQVAVKEGVNIDFQGGHVYKTGNLKIEGNARVLTLPSRIGHSQDYISASSLAIIKPGWSQVTECLISGIPFAVVETNEVEDGEIIEKLVKENVCFVIKEEELEHIDIKSFNMRAASLTVKRLHNSAKDVANMLLSRLKVQV